MGREKQVSDHDLAVALFVSCGNMMQAGNYCGISAAAVSERVQKTEILACARTAGVVAREMQNNLEREMDALRARQAKGRAEFWAILARKRRRNGKTSRG